MKASSRPLASVEAWAQLRPAKEVATSRVQFAKLNHQALYHRLLRSAGAWYAFGRCLRHRPQEIPSQFRPRRHQH